MSIKVGEVMMGGEWESVDPDKFPLFDKLSNARMRLRDIDADLRMVRRMSRRVRAEYMNERVRLMALLVAAGAELP